MRGSFTVPEACPDAYSGRPGREILTSAAMGLKIGIDNGLKGALCALSPHSQIIDWIPMPVKKWKGKGEIDIWPVLVWIDQVTGHSRSSAEILIEEPVGGQSANAVRSMAASFHSLRGLFEGRLIRYERISPRTWQDDLLPNCGKGQTKPRAKALAAELWPEETFIAPGCRTPHDGAIDAALIAEHARRRPF